MSVAGKSQMKVLLMGYSGYSRIDGHDVLMSSFSLTMDENVIQSSGVGKLYADEQFSRYKMNAVRDYPSYNLSVGVEANYDILDYIFTQITRKFHSFINVLIRDDASGILYEFDKCCLTSVELGVSNNDAAKVTFGFVTFKDEIEVEYCNQEGGYDKRARRNAPKELVGAVLMPYWAWGISTYDGDRDFGYLNDDDLYEFSISYTQSVTPKFESCGDDSKKALEPKKIVFGVPEAKYDFTYVVADPTKISDYLIASNEVAISRRNVKVRYKQILPRGSRIWIDEEDVVKFAFTMTDCYPDTYTPNYASNGSVNMITVSGTVYGKIEYDSDVNE